MQKGQLLMTQADRDRLVTLRKLKKRLITQQQAAEELGVSTRQGKRLLYALKEHGDKSVLRPPRQAALRIGERTRRSQCCHAPKVRPGVVQQVHLVRGPLI